MKGSNKITKAYCDICKVFTDHIDVPVFNDYGQEAIVFACCECNNGVVR